MLSDWIFYLVIGRLLIFLWMKLPLPKRIEKINTIKKLHECPLCSGCWIYGILSLFLNLDLLKVLTFTHVPFVSEFVTGCVISFIVHVFVQGWKSEFEIVVV